MISAILLPCVFKYVFGFDCPGCGAQRAFWALLNGQLADSFHYYPPLLPVLAVFVYLFYSRFFKKHTSASQKVIFLQVFIVIAIMSIIVNYTYKIATGHI